jgi:hypothetical protein
MCAIFSAHRINFDMIVGIVFGEEYKLWSSSLFLKLNGPLVNKARNIREVVVLEHEGWAWIQQILILKDGSLWNISPRISSL